MAVHGLQRLEQAKQKIKQEIPLPFEMNAGPRGGLLPSQLQPETGAEYQLQPQNQSVTKCLGLRHVTKCPERMDGLTFIWSVMSCSPSMSEQNGLNGRKASDWLRPYVANWAWFDIVGGVRLSSSDRRGIFEWFWLLTPSILEGKVRHS